MKRLYHLLIFSLALVPVLSMAQQNQTGQALTLEQCVQFALENSITIKNAGIDEEIAIARVKETRGIGLPQIDGNVTIQHNQKLPRFFGTKRTSFGFTGLPDSLYNEFLPELQDNDVIAGKNFFQLPSSGNAGLSISQLIFNSSYLVGLKAANTYKELSKKTTQQSKEQTVEQVTKAYYGVLINKDRLQLFDNNILRIESLLKTTAALHENGFTESIDVDRIRVTLNNLKSERNKFYNLQELSLQLLKFQMGYPLNQGIEVIGDISTLIVDENALSTYALNWDYTQRTDYQLLETNKRLLELDIKNKYSASLPSLAAFANLGYSTQSTTIGGVFKTNSNIKDNGEVGPDKWYPTSSFGIALTVPVFSGLQRNYRLQQAKLSLMKVQNGFTQMKSAIDLEIKQSAIAFLNAFESLHSQEENKQLAENIARVTKIKYEQGVGSNLEVIDAESSLKESQINYYSALYDALVAKIDLDRAYGKLLPQSSENK